MSMYIQINVVWKLNKRNFKWHCCDLCYALLQTTCTYCYVLAFTFRQAYK